jgi:hypothetical protein
LVYILASKFQDDRLDLAGPTDDWASSSPINSKALQSITKALPWGPLRVSNRPHRPTITYYHDFLHFEFWPWFKYDVIEDVKGDGYIRKAVEQSER